MLQLSPSEYLPIIRQLSDPTDSTTRYVRAYVYKEKGDGEALLATLDLVDKGSQRFTYYYQTPADSDPYYLSVITKIFDDSGYTTESTRYTRETAMYLVSERWGLQYGHGGGGVEVNYDKIRKMVKQELSGLPKPKEIRETDLNPLLKAIQQIENRVRNIDIPKPERADFSLIVRAIQKVKEEIKNIPEPEKPERLDLSPVLNNLEKMTKEIKELIGKIIEYSGELDKETKQQLKDIKGNLGRDIVLKKDIVLERGNNQKEQPKKRKWL